jgi:hypothetical protein
MTALQNVERTLGRIEKERTRLAQQLRTYLLVHRCDWRRVPYLALQADGRSGYIRAYAYAYTRGLWVINLGRDYSPFVDCATGRVVTYELEEVGDRTLLSCGLDSLRADKVIAELEKRASNVALQYTDPPEHERREAWRKDLATEYKLQPLYVRRKQRGA